MKFLVKIVEKYFKIWRRYYAAKMYKGIYDMPLINFLHCLINEDINYIFNKKHLKIKKIRDLFAKEHFAKISLEFTEAIGGGGMESLQQLVRYHILIGRIRILEAAFGLKKMNKNTIKILKKMGVFISDDRKSNILKINGVLSRYVREVKSLQKEFDKLDAENEKTKSISTYEDIISAISVQLKINLTLEVSIASFCSYYKIYKKQIEWQQKVSMK